MVEALLQQPAPRRGDVLAQHLADEVVAEAEAEPVDAEDPPLTEALELLGERRRIRVEDVGERLGRERLLEQRGGGEHAEGPRAFGAALREQRFGQASTSGLACAVRHRLGDEARIAARRLVQLGHAGAVRDRAADSGSS